MEHLRSHTKYIYTYYRLILRCRQDARMRFARLRSDVSVKLELLGNKHVQDVVWQLHKLVAGLANFHAHTLQLLKDNALFPIEMDLSRSAFNYKSTSPIVNVSTNIPNVYLHNSTFNSTYVNVFLSTF